MDDTVEDTLKKAQRLLVVAGPLQAIEYLGRSAHAAVDAVQQKLLGIVWNHHASLSSDLLAEEFLDPIHCMCDACGTSWLLSPMGNVLPGQVAEANLPEAGHVCPSCQRVLCLACARTNGRLCECGQTLRRLTKPNGRKRKAHTTADLLRSLLPKGPEKPTATTAHLHLYFGFKGRVPIGVDATFPQMATAAAADHLSWAETLVDAGAFYQAEQQIDLLTGPEKAAPAVWLRARLRMVSYHNAAERHRRRLTNTFAENASWDWPKEVLRDLEQATRLEPTFGPAWLTAAEAALECEPARALPFAERAQSLLGDTPAVLFALGRALRRADRPAEAAKCLQRVLEFNSTDANARREWELAHWEARCRAEPIDVEAHVKLGRWCWSNRQIERAKGLFTSLVTHCPDRPEGYCGLARLEFMGDGAERFGKTYELCQEALRRDPRHGRAWELLGNLFRRGTPTGNNSNVPMQDPLECYRRAIENDPTCDTAWWVLGTHFINEGNLDQAVAHLEKAAALETTTDEVYRMLAVIYLGRHEYDQASQADQKAQELAPHLALKSEFRERILQLCGYEP